MPSTISELFNHFMQLIGLKYYTKTESDNKYALKSEIPSSSTVDDSLSASSENPVQNKVIKNALDGKSDNGHTHSQYLTSHQDISGKVNVSDIKDNLTSTDTDKPLSANQGKVLKGLVDGKASSSHTHNTGEVSDTSAYTNIGSSANATQKTINDKINTAIGNKANSNNVYSKNETYTQSEITTLISNAVSNLQLFEVVSNLPTSNIKTNRLYLIVNDETITNNKYDIYLRVNDAWEQLDSLEFDISNYYKKSEIDTLLNGKVDTSDSRLTNARTPTSHSHGDITNTGTIGSTANKPLITTTNGKIATGSFGTTANTFCQGNDSRLSDARTPTAHTHTKSEISDFPTSMTPTSHTHTKSEITDFPSTMTPTSHTHGNLQNGGTISVSGTVQKSKNVVTDSNGYITTEAKPTIPTKTSQLTNDSGYLTSHQDITGKLDKAQGTSNASKNVVTDANGNITVEAKPTIPSANTTASNIKMNGTQSAGSLTSFAKADHIHPTDTSRVAVSQGTTNSGKFLKVNSSGNVACESVTIPSAYTHPTTKQCNYSVDISGKIDTAGTGLSKSGTTLNHSNSVTAQTTSVLKKIKYDAQGHITGTDNVTKTDITSLGIPSENTVYTHPSYTSKSNGLYKITVDGTGHVSATASVSASDIPTLTSSKISDLNSVIADAVGNLELFEVVTTLPTSNISNKKLYLVPNSVDGTTNKYDIYLRVSDAWEKIDSLDFNITDYIKKSSTNGLVKNDGSIDTNTYLTTGTASNTYLSKTDASNTYQVKGNYLTSHQDISGKANISDLGDVAFSNDYDDLDNLPSIPTNTNQLTNGAGFITASAISGKLDTVGNGLSKSGTTVSANFETTATNIKMNGTQSLGSLNTLARADHIHPTDTSRASSTHVHGNLNNDGTLTTVKSSVVSNDKFAIIDSTDNKLSSASVVDVVNKLVLDLINEASN